MPNRASILAPLLVAVLLGACTTQAARPGVGAEPSAAGETLTSDEATALGDAAWRARNLDLALLHFSRAQALEPNDDRVLGKIGVIQESRGQYDLARAAFERAVEIAPANSAAHERIGYLWLRESAHERAAEAFTAAVRAEPTRWRSLMGLGLSAEQRRDFPAARRHYDAALALWPNSAELLVASAEVWTQLGKLDLARIDANASLEIAATDGAWLALGDISARSGDYPAALAYYLKPLSEANGYYRLGGQAMRAGDFERAIGYYERAASASPTYFEAAYKSMAVAREQLAEARRRPARSRPAVTSIRAADRETADRP